jgi:AcrR family transcriptional regulator
LTGQDKQPKKRKSKTRERIIRAARDVFMEMGIDKAFIKEIADRAGVSRPTVYRHFSSIYQLAVEVELLMFEEAFQGFKGLDGIETDSVFGFRRLHHAWLDVLIEHPAYIRYCINFDQVFSGSDFPEALRQEFRSRAANISSFRDMNRTLGRILKPGIDPEDAIILLSESVMGIVQKMTVNRFHPLWTEKYQVHRIAHLMLDLLLDGLCREEE